MVANISKFRAFSSFFAKTFGLFGLSRKFKVSGFFEPGVKNLINPLMPRSQKWSDLHENLRQYSLGNYKKLCFYSQGRICIVKAVKAMKAENLVTLVVQLLFTGSILSRCY